MILQIIGYKNAGKTTLMSHAVSFLKSQGYKVATIKHHGHYDEDIQLQHTDVDHMKHFEAGADQSIVHGLEFQQTVTRVENKILLKLLKNLLQLTPISF